MRRLRRISVGGALTLLVFAAPVDGAAAAPRGVPSSAQGQGDERRANQAQQRPRMKPVEPKGNPASPAAIRAGRLSCGDVITKSTTLTADVGPCPGNGIIIGADNIRLNLNGHTIFGTPGPGDGTAAGIRLPNRSGVTVTGHPGDSGKTGTVTDFDAGVVLNRGSGNTIENLSVRDNVGPGSNADLGDGILLISSGNNRIVNNVVVGNGTYDGIGVLGLDSNANTIEGNVVEDTLGTPAPGEGTGIMLNAFFDPDDPRRGQSIMDNTVVGNQVRRNSSSGISNISNVNGTTARNTVEANGGNGIGVSHLFNAQPVTDVLVEQNEVHGNGTHGIVVASQGNRILRNDAANNAQRGGGGQQYFDLYDGSEQVLDGPSGCDSNVWFGNIWGTGLFYPECTSAGGSGPAVPPEGPVGDLTCSDARDNDLDGLTDARDTDCGAVLGREGPAGDPTCSDGVDNDGDWVIDGRDPDCGGVVITPTEGPRGDPTCTDGLDNDEDGLIDESDGDCTREVIIIDEGPIQEGPIQEGPIQEGPIQEGPIQEGPIQEP